VMAGIPPKVRSLGRMPRYDPGSSGISHVEVFWVVMPCSVAVGYTFQRSMLPPSSGLSEIPASAYGSESFQKLANSGLLLRLCS
jgi:hypothetical protein